MKTLGHDFFPSNFGVELRTTPDIEHMVVGLQ